jgi:hypothetical protein
MFYATLANPAQKRTIRPIYAQHQATTYGGFMDPTFLQSSSRFDVFPGTVMCRLHDEVFTPFTGAAHQVPFGLGALWCAPNFGVDEVTGTGQNLFSVWVGNFDAVFEVLAPAFDQTANWSNAQVTDGGITLLTGTSQGLLTPTGANNSNSVAELVSVEDPTKILVRTMRYNFASSVAVGGS